MAKLNINIVNATVDLIRNFQETPTECYSLFTFDILTRANSTVHITRVVDSGTYTSAHVRHDGVSVDIGTGVTVTLVEGTAKVTIKVPNVEPVYDSEGNQLINGCNSLTFSVEDTNTGEYESVPMFRCDTTVC